MFQKCFKITLSNEWTTDVELLICNLCLQQKATWIYRHFKNADITSVSGFIFIFTVPLTVSWQ